MFAAKTLAVSLLALAASVAATPVDTSAAVVPREYDGWRLVESTEVEGGVLSSFESTEPETPLAKRQCGSNRVTCDGSNVPSAAACQALNDHLTANRNNRFGTSIRSFCFTSGSDGQCCASWNANVPSGVLYGNLLPVSTAIRNQCVLQGRSGFATDVNLQGVCLTQCCSNRPTGC